MRIERIKVNNFKSLVDFEMPLEPFTCLIGLNGSGKSTVLQFIDFVGQLVRGDISGWLEARSWTHQEINYNGTRRVNVDFKLEIRREDGHKIVWKGTFNTQRRRCTRETILIDDEAELLVDGDRFSVSGKTAGKYHPPSAASVITFTYEGSILSQLKEDLLPGPLAEFRHFIENVRSLDLLAPEHLRKRTREAGGAMGLGGEKLSSFLHELGGEKNRNLFQKLKDVYPQLGAIKVKSLRSGWKQFEIMESFGKQKRTTEARHINDGLLRLTAIFAELESEHRVIVFDEIENGINPELVEVLIDTLTKASPQIVVTTHSPMILNYLDDEVAAESVMYICKTKEGHTKAIPFFEIPSMREKLNVMGPGEVFVDTRLPDLAKDIKKINKEN